MRRILLLLLILLLTVYGAAAAESGDTMDAVRALAWPSYKAAVEVARNSPGFGLSITMPDDRPDAPESLAGLLAGDTF